MLKIILFLLLVFSVFAENIDDKYIKKLENHLLSHDFNITGIFYYLKGRWVFKALTPDGKNAGLYLLLGQKPTQKNPFGWKKVFLDPKSLKKESGYFVYIGNKRNDPLAWVYADKRSGKVYKLIGANKGKFRYVLLKSLSYGTIKNIITFYNQTGSLKYSFLTDIELKRDSKSFGKIYYNPRYLDSKQDFTIKEPLKVTNLVIKERGYGKIEDGILDAEVVKYPFLGMVKIRSSYKNRTFVCEEHYEPLDSFLDINNSSTLKALIESWGEIKGMESTTCSQDYYENMKDGRFDFFNLEKSMDFSIKKDINITEKEGGQSRVVIHERIKLEKGD